MHTAEEKKRAMCHTLAGYAGFLYGSSRLYGVVLAFCGFFVAAFGFVVLFHAPGSTAARRSRTSAP